LILEKMIKFLFITFFISLLFISKSYSYVGPGMGAGIISVLIGFVVGLVAIFFAIIWFPIKKFLKKKSNNLEKKINEKDKDNNQM